MFGLDDWTMVAATIFALLNVMLAGLGMNSRPLFGYAIPYAMSRSQARDWKAHLGSRRSRCAAFIQGIWRNDSI